MTEKIEELIRQIKSKKHVMESGIYVLQDGFTTEKWRYKVEKI